MIKDYAFPCTELGPTAQMIPTPLPLTTAEPPRTKQSVFISGASKESIGVLLIWAGSPVTFDSSVMT